MKLRENSFLWQILIIAAALLVTEKIMPGISADGALTILAVAVLMGILNAFLKPFLLLITIPITVASLGIFYLVINALILQIAGALINGFHINSFGSAFWGAIVLSIFSMIIESFLKK
ncbi:MAG TPA: phage holin family protein [Candidatus Marinimicrobia bacterium]|nr:phage holin family protein [Candidatus Neomarinimicrobiota bacterium]